MRSCPCRDAGLSTRDPGMSTQLPIHFFTLVLNGMPFVRHHIEVFRTLQVPWSWHIVEGVASLSHDTAWSLENGGRIPDCFHREGRSVDGTTEYLDELARAFPGQVVVHRKEPGHYWDGKLEMVRAPLSRIEGESLLWQVDVDELWTSDQVHTVHRLFSRDPRKRAAYYWCHFFVGPDLVLASRNCYGNQPAGEWLRTWRFRPGHDWLSHEPPILASPWERLRAWERRVRRNAPPRQPLRPGDSRVFSHAETEAAGLVFQHLAYVIPEQVRFKELYYGYAGAEASWRRLQERRDHPLLLRDFFPWVGDEAMVVRASARGLRPLIPLAEIVPSPRRPGRGREPGLCDDDRDRPEPRS